MTPTTTSPARSRLAAVVAATALAGGVALTTTPSAGAIVNGREADRADHPWQVALTEETGEVFCGGTIVSPDQVVTAADCTEGLDPDEIVVRVGAADLDTDEGQVRRGAAVILHPDYERDDTADIAVLRIDEPLDYGPGVAPLVLATRDDLATAAEATVAGWGVLAEEDESDVRRLRQTDIPLVDDETCRLEMDADTTSELCAGGEGEGSCYGDSGGPLVLRTADGEPRLVGVVSWGELCGDDNPEVYSDVPDLTGWLVTEGGVDPDGAPGRVNGWPTLLIRGLLG